MLVAREPSNLGVVFCMLCLSDNFEIHYAHFDLSAFDISLFKKVSIDLPIQIASAVTKRQAEFFYGRLCSQAALTAAGSADAQVGIGPFREPVWPPEYTGSITHNDSTAAAIVIPKALCAGIGIDIETVKGDAVDALRSTIVSPRELAYVQSFDGGIEVDMLLTLVFSAKESFYKGMTGQVQRVLDFDVIEMVNIDCAARTLCFEVREMLGGQFVPGYRFQVAFRLLDDAHVMTLFHR